MADAAAIKVRRVEITPKAAQKLLDANTHNRTVVNARVDQYAADMRRGEWQLNGEAIKIADDGTILDGQHRLMAVLEADRPIQTLLITGLDAETQETMDQGRPRTLADVFKLRGEKYHNPLATACRTLAIYESHRTVVQPAYTAAPTVQQASRTLDRNPDLRDSVALTYSKRRPWMPSSHMGAMHYLFATVDREAADDFVEKLHSGEALTRDNAIYLLREKFIQDQMDRTPTTVRMQLALIIKAWNHYLAGDSITRLVWTPGGAAAEPFPEISGLQAGRP